MISLADLFRYGRGFLVPAEPVSLYRYVEHLVEVAVIRKYRCKSILEIGPGTDPVFAYLQPSDYQSGTIIDYNEAVLRHCEKTLAGRSIETVLMDVERDNKLADVRQRWDCIVSNGVVEHLKDDVVHLNMLRELLSSDGIILCTTVLHRRLQNEWDHAVGHYRRYSVAELRRLFADFKEVQIIRTSLVQELVRPLFFGRIRHLLANSLEENNRRFGEGVQEWSRPPYVAVFGLLRYFMPLYLVVDWAQSRFVGGIVIVVARK
jgi:SAM-dependent methyltransferase